MSSKQLTQSGEKIQEDLNKIENLDTSKLVTTEVSGGVKVVKLTQKEYDNLTDKDENALYLIVG